MWTFRAMNTDVTVCAPALDQAAEHALAVSIAALFDTTERRFSRFLATSELSRLNRATHSVVVSAELLDLLRACRRHVADTRGLFDPTIGGALVAAGYDRTFAPGALDRDHVSDAPRRVRFDEVGIDESARIVYRPPHVQLDFGGFLKGRTVDRAAQTAPATALIDAGGDMVVRGAGADGDGWLVDIEDPRDPHATVATLRVRDRAVATSAANRRRWQTGPTLAHHLIDPRSGLPSTSDLAQVTVLAPTAERADVAAKTTFLLGSCEGRHFIADRAELAAVLVTQDGSVDFVGDMEVVSCEMRCAGS